MSLSNSPIPLCDLQTDLNMAGINPESIAAVLQVAREFAKIVTQKNEQLGCQNVTIDTGLYGATDRTPLESGTTLDLSSPEMQAFRIRCKALVGAIQGEERRRIANILARLGTSNPDVALFHSIFSDFLGSGDNDPFSASHRRVFDLDETQITESQDFLQHALHTLSKSSVTEDVRSLNVLLQRVNQSGLPEKVNFSRQDGSPVEEEAHIQSLGMRETLDQVFLQMRTVATKMYTDLVPSFATQFSRPSEENDFSAQDAVYVRQVLHGLYHVSSMFLQKILRELPSEEQQKFSVLCWAQVLSSVSSSLSLHCLSKDFAVTIADAEAEEGEIPEAFDVQLKGIQQRSKQALPPTGHSVIHLISHGMKHAIGWSSQAFKSRWLLEQGRKNGTKADAAELLSTPLANRLAFTAVIPGQECIYSSLPPDVLSRDRREMLQNFSYTGNDERYAPLSKEDFKVEEGLSMHRYADGSGFGTGHSQFIDAKTILGDDHPIIEVGNRVHTTLQKMRNHILAEEGSPLAGFPALRRALEESAIPVRYIVFDMGRGNRSDILIFTDDEARTLGIDHCQNCQTPDDEDMASILGLQIRVPSPDKEGLRLFTLNPDDDHDHIEPADANDPHEGKNLIRGRFTRRLIPVLEA